MGKAHRAILAAAAAFVVVAGPVIDVSEMYFGKSVDPSSWWTWTKYLAGG